MIRGQTLKDKNNYEVALFPLESFIITQRDDETYSHDPSRYLATDYQAFYYTSGSDTQTGTGYVLNYHEYYAPVKMTCVAMDTTNASILWRSVNRVHLANGSIDYLILLFYHDNKVPAGDYSVGQVVNQGDIIGYTGTYGNGGSSVANHVHMESGYGQNWSRVYQSPNYGHIDLDYALHNYDAMYGNSSICYGISSYPDKYPWKIYNSNIPDIRKGTFPWYIIAKKRRQQFE